jgi:hypothetical protein
MSCILIYKENVYRAALHPALFWECKDIKKLLATIAAVK